MNIQTFYSNISKQYCPKLAENSSKTISIRIPYVHMRPLKAKKLPVAQNTKTNINSSSGNFLEGFADFCESPEFGKTGKGSSYVKAIQYLCDFLNINLQSFTKDDLAIIKSHENDISSKHCDFYNDLLIDLENKNHRSYLASGYIKAALPYFYAFCEKKL